VREALSNVARHARAAKVEVVLSSHDERLALTVTDDGDGIPSSHRLGSGLLNMSDRAVRMGGTCTVTSGEHAGTTVRWTIPIDD
jgi:signal transduction histidine kinase